ncbi:MAG: HlyD family efflux transporter periplasmic adaptor subunit [Psychrobium sp.]|nr:HlyD family efflux transporter periplasmic adaptor subunit [Psychrobium sp.]
MNIELGQAKPIKRIIAVTVFLLMIAYALYSALMQGGKSVAAAQLEFSQVVQGPLDIYVNTFGEFVSAKERLLTAPALGKVAEIMVRPGATVSPETVILRLVNPQLEQQVSQAKGTLAQRKAAQTAFKFEQENALLDYQGRIEDLKAKLEQAELELAVNEKLLAMGTVSKIKLQRAKLTAKQSISRLSFEKRRFKKFIEMQSYQLTQKKIEVQQQQDKVTLLIAQLAQMSITAGLNGTLQTLEVALGQSVNLGQSIAKVGSIKDLIAKLRLPQRQADQITLGARVMINTQKGKIAAHISRIETLVNNGSVLAEAILDGELTSNARPALPISAKIFLEHQPKATYVKQSPGLRANSKHKLFVRTSDNQLVQREVIFGQLSDNKLLIASGLVPNEIIVSSDMKDYQQYSNLELVL